MADYRGIFSLQELYEEQQSDNWAVAKESSFTKPPYSLPWNYGYVAGGTPAPGLTSTVQRMDMSNDNNVNSVRGPLTRAAYVHDGIISSDTHGYFLMGSNGYGGPYTTDINRIEYANDTINAVPKGNLAVARTGSMSSNTSYGYNAGGYNGSNAISTVDRIDFSNDTANATPKGPLSAAKYRHTGVGNQDYGYASAGSGAPVPPAPARTYIDRIDYSNDSATALNRVDMGTYSDGQATGNADYGYFYKTAETLKYDYANDTTALTPVGIFGTAVYRSGGISNSQYGYVMGGSLIPGTNTSLIQRTDFSNDTATLAARGACSRAGAYIKTTSNQSNGRIDGSGSFNLSVPNNQTGITTTGATVNFEKQNVFSYNFGYIGGGYYSPPTAGVSSIERLDFSNDTASLSVRGNFVASRKQLAGGVSNENFGYTLAGYNGSGPTTNTERLDYSNDNGTILTKGDISQQIQAGAPLSGNGYGYLCGGTNPSPPTTDRIERLDFSNDTTNTVQRTLSSQKTNVAGVGNRDYGYVVGGYLAPNRNSTIERIDYSNDLPGGNPRALLPSPLSESSAIGNANYGYAVGGYDGSYISKIFRIDYANDTSTAPHRTNMIFAANRMGVNGNNDFGYVYGSPLPTVRSTVQRIDYSNDTAEALFRGGMGTARGETQGFSSRMMGLPQPPRQINDLKAPLPVANAAQQYGYYGMFGPSPSTTINRLDFANDTNQGIAVGPGGPSRNYINAVSSLNHGYFVGGFNSGPVYFSNLDRLDYANDTQTAAQRSSMANARYSLASTGNTSYGWIGGGSPGNISTVERIDYANDDTTPSTRGPLSDARYSLAAIGNQNYGYWSGGYSAALTSVTDRVDYSNDTPTASPKGVLSAARIYLSATGNADYGWFGGGTPGPGPNRVSIVDRIDYSNDTATASPKGPLSQSVYLTSAAGNKSYGYFAGGNTGPVSTVDRIDYSNDTVTAKTRTFLTAAKYTTDGGASAANYGNPQG